ncbi:MAG: hypothetical protein ABSF70_07095 [Terracidiphilus sp.]
MNEAQSGTVRDTVMIGPDASRPVEVSGGPSPHRWWVDWLTSIRGTRRFGVRLASKSARDDNHRPSTMAGVEVLRMGACFTSLLLYPIFCSLTKVATPGSLDTHF